MNRDTEVILQDEEVSMGAFFKRHVEYFFLEYKISYLAIITGNRNLFFSRLVDLFVKILIVYIQDVPTYEEAIKIPKPYATRVANIPMNIEFSKLHPWRRK